MRRFITYIYEYEQGNRGRNTGFIRTDLRENSCRMELQIRGFDRFKGKCPVYLTVYENGLQAIPVTELLLTQGMGTCSFTCENNRIGNSGFDVHQGTNPDHCLWQRKVSDPDAFLPLRFRRHSGENF